MMKNRLDHVVEVKPILRYALHANQSGGRAMWKFFDPNPRARGGVGDCVIRAICAVTGEDWDNIYWALCEAGASVGNWGNANSVWRGFLRRLGYRQRAVPNSCPDCYTVRDFAADHPRGSYVLATGSGNGTHAVAVVDGRYVDAWDSGNETVIYYFER